MLVRFRGALAGDRGLYRSWSAVEGSTLLKAAGFRSGLQGVVQLAGDVDTNGAVAGALLGARFGLREIPRNWLGTLRAKDELLESARR